MPLGPRDQRQGRGASQRPLFVLAPALRALFLPHSPLIFLLYGLEPTRSIRIGDRRGSRLEQHTLRRVGFPQKRVTDLMAGMAGFAPRAGGSVAGGGRRGPGYSLSTHRGTPAGLNPREAPPTGGMR